jgi:hypothetical protein
LANARGGVFCAQHDLEYGDKCRVIGCESAKIRNTQACEEHQNIWLVFQNEHKRQNLPGTV